MKPKFFSLVLLVLYLGFTSCIFSDDPEEQPVKKETFSGYVQKGPFISGSSVTLYELDNGLNQTGRSYSATVLDNSGSFEHKQIELISRFTQLKADGYYFNEVSGKPSSGQLTLYALADISQVSSANVNVLTHLEKGRAEYLIREQGLSFAAAKAQAQQEVLSIFNLDLRGNAMSESLSLTSNGILLAVSSIVQGHLSTAAMSELMADIIADIRTDGTLDEPSLGSQLIDNARLLRIAKVRQNLESKYSEPGMGSVVVPQFESYIQQFIDKTTFEPQAFITYPETSGVRINILAVGVSKVKVNSSTGGRIFHSMKAGLPEGTSLKVVLKGGSWSVVGYPAPENWTIGDYDYTSRSQVFTVTQSGIPNDLRIAVDPGEITVEYYENGADEPTFVKQVVAEI
jgi:hypothetical protein